MSYNEKNVNGGDWVVNALVLVKYPKGKCNYQTRELIPKISN